MNKMDLNNMFDKREIERMAKMQEDINKCIGTFKIMGNVFGFLGTISLCVGCSFLSVLVAISDFVNETANRFMLPSILGLVLSFLCKMLEYIAFPMICQARCNRIANEARKDGKEEER